MPYGIKRVGGKFQVISQDTGRVHGTHPSRSDAAAQLRALYANANPANEKPKRWAAGYKKRK